MLKRTGRPVPMQAGRDLWWHEAIEGQPPVCEPEWVDAEHPLFLLYTSGSTGKPKGIQHSSAGYLLGAKPRRSGCSICATMTCSGAPRMSAG